MFKLFLLIITESKDLEKNSFDYDTWFDLLRLLEAEGDHDQTRDSYEKAIAQIPPIKVI